MKIVKIISYISLGLGTYYLNQVKNLDYLGEQITGFRYLIAGVTLSLIVDLINTFKNK